MTTPTHDELFHALGHALLKWAEILSKQVGPDEAARLMFAAGVSQMTASCGKDRTIEFLRDLAAEVDSADLSPRAN